MKRDLAVAARQAMVQLLDQDGARRRGGVRNARGGGACVGGRHDQATLAGRTNGAPVNAP